MNKIFNKSYIFIEQLEKLNKIKLLKLININIIIDVNEKTEKSNEKELFIIKFAKKNKIPFIIKNNFKKCFKYNANGIFLDSTNKNRLKPIFYKKNFDIRHPGMVLKNYLAVLPLFVRNQNSISGSVGTRPSNFSF